MGFYNPADMAYGDVAYILQQDNELMEWEHALDLAKKIVLHLQETGWSSREYSDA